MNEKLKKLLAKKMKSLQKDNDMLVSEIKKLKEKINRIQANTENKKTIKSNKKRFKEFVKDAKKSEDIVGKAFLIKKEAKVGSNTWVEETYTAGGNRKNSLETLENMFGKTETSKNMISHTYESGRAELFTVDGQPVDECSVALDGEYTYDKANFKINKYALKLPTSIEFVEFVVGGSRLASKLVLDLKNLIAKHSLNADSPINGQYGLFNTSANRGYERVVLATAGIITADELLDLRYTPLKGIVETGTYVVPQSALRQISLIKNGEGNYIFATGNGGITLAGFPQVGVIANRPVVVIPDDIWFAVGMTLDTLDGVVCAYLDNEAFEYYVKAIEEYRDLMNTIDEGENIDDYVVVEVKPSTEAGCIELVAMSFEGFGVTDPTAGALLVNPAVIRDGKGTKKLTKEQMKKQIEEKRKKILEKNK